MKKGRLISFEGPDGAGKSTQIKRLEAFLEARGFPYICSREPGGTPIGEKLRELIQKGKIEPVASPYIHFML